MDRKGFLEKSTEALLKYLKDKGLTKPKSR
jgi:hypothetical protein